MLECHHTIYTGNGIGLRLPYLGNYPPGVSPTAHTNNSEQVYPNLPVI